MKNFYIAIIECKDDKFGAYVTKVTECNNLVKKIQGDNIIAANICETKKRATELAITWNDSFKADGKYLFDTAI